MALYDDWTETSHKIMIHILVVWQSLIFIFSRPRSGNNNNNRSSPRSRTTIAEGVYNNSHFLHAAASQVGNPVRVKTKGGVVVEGIFRTFSENFHVRKPSHL